jgi:two-component system, chemotaxis family, protein-glutamate methylesterase/glutaminase
MKPCRVLIVDDSRTMRSLIAAALSLDPLVDVVGEAGDAFEARMAIKELAPDVVTLDIEMPGMNGLDFLERIMRLRPTPVIVISSLTERGTDTSIRTLEIGAVDCIAKPSAKDRDTLADLAARIKAAAAVRLQSRGATAPERADGTLGEAYRPDGRVVAIGASMGGVEALFAVLKRFPENCPPTVVTQHMPAMFTRRFAERLDRSCKPNVREAMDGDPLQPGTVYIAPGGAHHLEVHSTTRPRCRLVEGGLVSGHRPSVDALFESVARTLKEAALGVILTGMGRDGASGLKSMRQRGAQTLGQNEATSLVYGMPKAAFEMGGVELQLSLDAVGDRILMLTNAKRTG